MNEYMWVKFNVKEDVSRKSFLNVAHDDAYFEILSIWANYNYVFVFVSCVKSVTFRYYIKIVPTLSNKKWKKINSDVLSLKNKIFKISWVFEPSGLD